MFFNILGRCVAAASARHVSKRSRNASYDLRFVGRWQVDALVCAAMCELDWRFKMSFRFGGPGSRTIFDVGPTTSAVMVLVFVPKKGVRLGGHASPDVSNLGEVPLTDALLVTASPAPRRGNRLFAQRVSWCRAERLTLLSSCFPQLSGLRSPQLSWCSVCPSSVGLHQLTTSPPLSQRPTPRQRGSLGAQMKRLLPATDQVGHASSW